MVWICWGVGVVLSDGGFDQGDLSLFLGFEGSSLLG